MNFKQSKQYMEDWLLLQPKEVRDNLKVFSNEDTLTKYLLRIDYETPKIFTPRLPVQSNVQKGEDFICPRVCTCEHLAGCVLGYSRIHYDQIYGDENGKHTGIYEISAIPFIHAVLPNSNLVPDASRTQEAWAVAYSPRTTEYIPESVGVIYIQSVNVERIASGKNRAITYICYIRITSDHDIAITSKDILTRGYYQAVFTDNDGASSFRVTEHAYKSISKDEFNRVTSSDKSTRVRPSLESIPAWARW